MLLPIMYW